MACTYRDGVYMRIALAQRHDPFHECYNWSITCSAEIMPLGSALGGSVFSGERFYRSINR
ncbi:hypothetical protein PMI09_00101 [Rhizobium sp. CF122]|nr:hypothetical protein PMI09_00101 [Rhizobium sp. CF122]